MPGKIIYIQSYRWERAPFSAAGNERAERHCGIKKINYTGNQSNKVYSPPQVRVCSCRDARHAPSAAAAYRASPPSIGWSTTRSMDRISAALTNRVDEPAAPLPRSRFLIYARRRHHSGCPRVSGSMCGCRACRPGGRGWAVGAPADEDGQRARKWWNTVSHLGRRRKRTLELWLPRCRAGLLGCNTS